MSINDLNKAFELIKKNIEKADFDGKKGINLITLAENKLGLKFPNTYKIFLEQLGCGAFAGEEFYGIINNNFENSSVPNGIWLTLRQRIFSNLPDLLVIIYGAGDGSYYAIDISKKDENGESPIVQWIPGKSKPNDILEIVENDFGKFFFRKIQESLTELNL